MKSFVIPAVATLLALAFAPPALAGADSWVDNLDPIATEDWSYARAAHLLERAGFGGTPDEIAFLANMPPAAAVVYLVDYESIANDHLPPFDESGIFDDAMMPFPASRADAVRQARENGECMGVKVNTEGTRRIQPVVNKFFYGLRANGIENRRAQIWWANRMLATKRPLEEKMALFWHDHFATSDTKVRDYRKMLIQLGFFHENATGNFRDLLLGVTQDPAMLTFLDNAENVKEHPNENFGRELMELFSMGVGNYTEKDIREAARAFTGWTDERLEFVIHEERHDTGDKTVLGRTGNFDGEDVIDIILDQPATAGYMAAKIYRYLVREELSDSTRAQLAGILRENRYELKPLIKTIFLSKDFYSDASVGTQIKGPVQLAVSTYKKLGLEELPTIPDFTDATGALGQTLFYPPNVAGWAEGRSWITPATLLQRANLMRDILFPNVDGFVPPDRTMPGIYRRVGERLAQGMNITEATKEGDSAFNMMADADEDYNTRYGGYMGYVMAYEVIEPIPRFPANIDLVAMLRKEEIGSGEAAVDYFVRRFLSVELSPVDRNALIAFIRARNGGDAIDYADANLETNLRGLLHLVLSAPEYQLS